MNSENKASNRPKENPSYISAYESGRLKATIEKAFSAVKRCGLCPRNCGVNRLSGEKGVCQTGRRAWVSSFGSHFGEESPLVGSGGSGTIFFTHCNLGCNFCQNYDISHQGIGQPVDDGQLARFMLELQASGCHNINLVTPSHVVPQILSALEKAIQKGLRLPLVFNTGAYDCIDTLSLLNGIVDIYMPDFKFWKPETADATCQAPDYPEVAKKAILEMFRQVGDLATDGRGLAVRGLLVRHLVMPDGEEETRKILQFIASEISLNTYVNIMPQYRPCGTVSATEPLGRPLREQEYIRALKYAEILGLHRLDHHRRIFMAE